MNNDVGAADRPTRVRYTSGENTGLLLIPTHLLCSVHRYCVLIYCTYDC